MVLGKNDLGIIITICIENIYLPSSNIIIQLSELSQSRLAEIFDSLLKIVILLYLLN